MNALSSLLTKVKSRPRRGTLLDPGSALRRAERHIATRQKGRKGPRFEAPPEDGKIRLNLGCGDKKLPGYVNVDLAPSRKGVVPDVVSDLRKLDFPDGHADEILSVHVIEHFHYWDVPGVLSEWRRVLKPGGRLVLECPNLLVAARALLKDPSLAAKGGKDWATTMFVFYGDPGWEDPLMCHRWGWTPESLTLELERAGFIEVREEPALFKKGNPRDMRIVGIKAR